MKKLYFFFLTYCFILSNSQITYNITPSSFNENEQITLSVPGNQINETAWGVTNNAIYLWSWSYDQNFNNSQDCPTNGTWSNSNEANRMVYNATSDLYSLTFTPTQFYNRTGIGRFGFLLKTKTGNFQTSPDILVNVGTLTLSLTQPMPNSISSVASGGSLSISATTTAPATFQLKANGGIVHTVATPSTSYNYNYTVSGDANLELTATDNNMVSRKANFMVQIPQNVISQAIPSWIKQGINYDPADPTKVGLALYAPHKNFIHVIGSFNAWQVNSNYLMKRDTANPDLYWLEITNLTPMQIYTFQYRTNDLRTVADPFSSQILSSYDDPFISANTYPNLPVFPTGQNFEVSVIQTGKMPYPWQVTNFQSPNKEDLVIYELLLRDFTQEKNWQSLINKIPYIKSLNVNAIELMPIMEFDGNNSWGYNTSFHYALDKAYGTPDKFKEFVDLCHQNGIAIILDIAFNHATGRSPLVRLWNEDPDGDGYGAVAPNNPYFNTVAKHSYSVFNDFNHAAAPTKYYVERTLEQWISEYKIDGFRWDLTKGFTQNCSENDQNCTNAYQQDRVDILKYYADKQWQIDPNSYIIFEHLGTDLEEQQWANYKVTEGKGVLLWNHQNNAYSQNTMGYVQNSNFDRMNHQLHGFTQKHAVGYGESHDEERLMYKNLNYGAVNGTYDVKNLTTALERMKTFGAAYFTIPGPKMIWQFGELGFDFSINTCTDGTINNNCRTDPKLVPFTLGYDMDASRMDVKSTWAAIINLRKNHPIFKTKTYTVESNNLTNDPSGLITRIYLDDQTQNGLKNVVVLANFGLTTRQVVPFFPYTGQWVNLMQNSSYNVSSTTAPITLLPGEFRIFGSSTGILSIQETTQSDGLSLVIKNNPTKSKTIEIEYKNVKNGYLWLFDASGKKMKIVILIGEKGQYQWIEDAPAGVYYIKIEAENGQTTKKIILQ